MSDFQHQFPSRWPKTSGTLHRYRVALVTSVNAGGIFGTVFTPAGDGTPPVQETNVELKRGIECRGFIGVQFNYPVMKRGQYYHIIGGGLWSGIGQKQGIDKITIYGAESNIIKAPEAPWVTDWNSLTGNANIGCCWDETLQGFFPVVAKC